MVNLIREDYLKEGNLLLKCYMDVLKVLLDIEKGKEPPDWFDFNAGTCSNVELSFAELYCDSEMDFYTIQRQCVNDDHYLVRGESKLDYILNRAWVRFINDMGNSVRFVDENSSRIYPIFSEFPDMIKSSSYIKSAKGGTLYRGKQLEARISLIDFKCMTLYKELFDIGN